MRAAALEIDLEVFQGPFDLLLSLVLGEEVDLLEVELAEVVLAYLDHLERAGELELEPATEFLVLVASLCELKSRLMLPREEADEAGLEPVEAADELLARLLEYRRYRAAAGALVERLGAESDFRYRSAPLPAHLRRAPLEGAEQAYEPELLARAIGGLLAMPEPIDLGHIGGPAVSLESRLSRLRSLLAASAGFSFDEAVASADRITEALTLFALLELYKSGEADWRQEEPFGDVWVTPAGAHAR